MINITGRNIFLYFISFLLARSQKCNCWVPVLGISKTIAVFPSAILKPSIVLPVLLHPCWNKYHRVYLCSFEGKSDFSLWLYFAVLSFLSS